MGPVLRFYCDGLGLPRILSFSDHDGYSGVVLGLPGTPYHLEFTTRRLDVGSRAPSDDNLLVFYLPSRAAWEGAVGRMRAAGFAPVEPANPYWRNGGVTFEDPDGWRVVLMNDGGIGAPVSE